VTHADSKELGAASVAALPQRVATNFGRWWRALARASRARLREPRPGFIATLVLLAAAAVAAMFFVDTTASAWARQVPPWFRETFEWITDLGLSGWFLYPLGSILLYLAAVTSPALPRFTQGVLTALTARCGYLFLAIALPGLFTTIVKRMIGRARPFVGGHDDPFLYAPFSWQPAYASMPSGHATTAAAAAIAFGSVWPRARPVMWLYALIIVFSRVVVVAHHPSDVIAGAAVGVLGAAMVRRYFAARGLVFSARDLRPYPGPSWRRLKVAVRQIAGS
jgi:membrane-associated phospholipid phosphatase